jgi:hypothetical protein
LAAVCALPPIKVARAEKSVFRVKRAFPAAAST